MTPGQVAFLRRLIQDRPESRARGEASDGLAQGDDLGQIRGSRVYYTALDFKRARDLLTSRGYDVEPPKAPFDRDQAPRGSSEKSGALPVTHQLVALQAMNMPEVVIPTGSFLAMRWPQALAYRFEVLMVVENLRALQRLHEYRWLDGFVRGRPVLAVFRGAPDWFRIDAAAAMLAADERPVLAFFDFDPKGLAMAASVPRREALCLPDLQVLRDRTNEQRRKNLYFQSHDSAASTLNRSSDPEIQSAWKLMTELTLGLDQEHFSN